MKQPCVYLLANRSHGSFYVGVTANLIARLYQHREGAFHENMETAVLRERQVKRWGPAMEIRPRERRKPTWRDLAEDFGFAHLPLARQAGPGSSPG